MFSVVLTVCWLSMVVADLWAMRDMDRHEASGYESIRQAVAWVPRNPRDPYRTMPLAPRLHVQDTEWDIPVAVDLSRLGPSAEELVNVRKGWVGVS